MSKVIRKEKPKPLKNFKIYIKAQGATRRKCYEQSKEASKHCTRK